MNFLQDFPFCRQIDTSSKDKNALAAFSLPEEPASLQTAHAERVGCQDMSPGNMFSKIHVSLFEHQD